MRQARQYRLSDRELFLLLIDQLATHCDSHKDISLHKRKKSNILKSGQYVGADVGDKIIFIAPSLLVLCQRSNLPLTRMDQTISSGGLPKCSLPPPPVPFYLSIQSPHIFILLLFLLPIG
ncbi:hypothetical protein CEXT_231141 [Caerostris extrusa]|uniref:Uncharacterized protein n=1 Tax=Caerostris extrusa TaxID=172846 RepID=A0AAV4R0F4_CAEEX|nr:hypothetical protein CEXT_231141 [Caerostris extrusa]